MTDAAALLVIAGAVALAWAIMRHAQHPAPPPGAPDGASVVRLGQYAVKPEFRYLLLPNPGR